jgi:3-deoxy-manno-octulosonate cytidylyltransferase (CMP-KDO synthetase)
MEHCRYEQLSTLCIIMTNYHYNIIAVIPARYGSTRFPGKALADINGKPMIQWVYERTARSKMIHRVIVATDDERILRAVKLFGGEAIMTSSHHLSGTDRIAEVTESLDCDLVVNVQGDEPLIQSAMIDEVISPLACDPSILMGTLCRKIEDRDEAFDPNVVKVVFDINGFALYFSRAPIPWDRDSWAFKDSWQEHALKSPLYKHIGIYVYRREFLLSYSHMPQTALEAVEKLEQLRAIEHGYRIKTVVTGYDSFGVDIPDDLSKILARIEES